MISIFFVTLKILKVYPMSKNDQTYNKIKIKIQLKL